MRRIGVLAGLVSTMLVASLVACGSKPPSSSPGQSSPASGSIVVFAAASLKPAFTQLSQQFKTDNPGSGVEFEFAGSSELATQLTQGASADVFASADTAQMDTVVKAGLLAGDPTNFAANTLVIVTARVIRSSSAPSPTWPNRALAWSSASSRCHAERRPNASKTAPGAPQPGQ